MIDFDTLLTDEEKAAIATLEAGGFVSLAEARINDCRDLNSGKRLRTFRLRGRYDIVIACRNLAGRQLPEPVFETVAEIEPVDKQEEDTTQRKPVSEMTKAELLAEAKEYEEITGEYKMDKAELAEAVQAQRDRRDLINRKFEV